MTFLVPQKLYGIIGWPLAQTLSPLIHNCGFQTLDMPAVYLKWEIPDGNLGDFVQAMRILPISGCSVTIPHKIKIMAFMDEITRAAALAGAVNTVSCKDGKLVGDNTDVAGFLKPLPEGMPKDRPILLLGAGGAAHAVCAGLAMLGCNEVTITSHGDKSQYPLAEEFGFQATRWTDRYARPYWMVINSTPLGMKGKDLDANPYDFGSAPAVEGGCAYDLVYNPFWTKFLLSARERGRTVISGLEMFYWQANDQFHIWTGSDLPDSARELLEKALQG